MGDTLATARRWDEAHADYRASIEAAKGRGDPALVARMWDAEGRAFERQNDFPKALAPHREALQLRQQISHETLAVAASLNRLGLASLVRGELAAAEDYLKRALALREKLAPESLDVAASLNGLGNVARERGELVTAEESFRRSLAIREKLAPDSLEVAISLNNVGLVVERRGDLAAAAELFRRALAISEKQAPDSLMVANILNNLGMVTKERDLAAGEVFYRRSLAISEKLAPGSLDVAGRLNNLGILAFDRGDLVAAEEFYRRSLAIKEKLAANSLSVALTLNNLGLVAKERGDLAAADEFYRRSLAIKEKLAADTLTVTLTLINLGEVAMIRGDQIEAEEFFKRSLAILEKVAPGSLTLAGALTALGQVAEAQGNLAGAEELFRRSLAIKERLAPESLGVAASLTNLAGVSKKRGDLAAAEASLEAALTLRRRLAPGSAGESEVLFRLGLLAREASRQEVAADYFQRAVSALEAQTGRLGGADEVRSGFSAQYAGYYREYVDLLVELNQGANAFNVLERSRARSLLAMLAERDLVFAADLPGDLGRERTLVNADYDRTQSAIARLSPAKDAAEIERLLARLRELRDKREQITQTIRKASPRFASLQYPQPLDLDGAQESLDTGTALLSYCVTKDQDVPVCCSATFAAAGANGAARFRVHSADWRVGPAREGCHVPPPHAARCGNGSRHAERPDCGWTGAVRDAGQTGARVDCGQRSRADLARWSAPHAAIWRLGAAARSGAARPLFRRVEAAPRRCLRNRLRGIEESAPWYHRRSHDRDARGVWRSEVSDRDAGAI